jgi:VanZ family protein
VKIKVTSFIPGIAWFIVTIFLFCMPGNDLPESDFFPLPYFDKLVHFGMFFLLTALFSWPLRLATIGNVAKKRWFLLIAVVAFAYGIIIEFVQANFVPYRSYDNWDILADGIGCLGAYLWSLNYLLRRDSKKIGPNGNRGRNQN